MEKGKLKRIINKHTIKRNLEEVDVPLGTIRRRVLRIKLVVMTSHHGGHTSPLESIDDVIVNIILMMARVRQRLNPSKGMA